uniref:Uncharacterized protein n=1 Tax=Octopus bimaculoides TaxID=37653 RepID=A0A0L8H3E9_OCTBM
MAIDTCFCFNRHHQHMNVFQPILTLTIILSEPSPLVLIMSPRQLKLLTTSSEPARRLSKSISSGLLECITSVHVPHMNMPSISLRLIPLHFLHVHGLH